MAKILAQNVTCCSRGLRRRSRTNSTQLGSHPLAWCVPPMVLSTAKPNCPCCALSSCMPQLVMPPFFLSFFFWGEGGGRLVADKLPVGLVRASHGVVNRKAKLPLLRPLILHIKASHAAAACVL